MYFLTKILLVQPINNYSKSEGEQLISLAQQLAWRCKLNDSYYDLC